MHDALGGASRRRRLVRSEDDEDWQDEPAQPSPAPPPRSGHTPAPKPMRGRERVLEAVQLTVAGRPDDALALLAAEPPSPLGQAVVAVLRRLPPPRDDDEAFLLWRALEAWQAGASLAPIRAEACTSAAVRLVLGAPPRTG